MEYSDPELVFHFFKATFKTSIKLSQSFFGKWNLLVQNLNAIQGIKFTSSEFCLQFTKTEN